MSARRTFTAIHLQNSTVQEYLVYEVRVSFARKKGGREIVLFVLELSCVLDLLLKLLQSLTLFLEMQLVLGLIVKRVHEGLPLVDV